MRVKALRAVAMVACAGAAAPVLAGAVTVTTFEPGLGGLVSIAAREAQGLVYLYPAFGDVQVRTLAGAAVTSYDQANFNSNDIDLDMAHAAVNIGGTVVPAGTLLVFNGEVATQYLTALHSGTGAVLAQVELAEPVGNIVGGTLSPAGDALYVVDWTTDLILRYDPATGAQVASFSVVPFGSPPFDVFYGDIDVASNGNILVVSDSQLRVRELTQSGQFVRDIDVSSYGIAGMSGIDTTPTGDVAWISSTNGKYWRVTGLPGPAPTCPADLDGNGSVGSTDLNILLGNFGQVSQAGEADPNGDGVTDSTDLNVVLAAFGQGC